MKEVKYECTNCLIDCQYVASEFDSKAGTKLTEYKCRQCDTRYQLTLKGTTVIKLLVMRDGKILSNRSFEVREIVTITKDDLINAIGQ